MDGQDLIKPLPVPEEVGKELSLTARALMGEFVLRMLRGGDMLASLTAEIPDLVRDEEKRSTYIRLLLALCTAHDQGEETLSIVELGAKANVVDTRTLGRYIAPAVKAGHLVEDVRTGEGRRRHFLKATEKTMIAYKRDMDSVARIVPKISTIETS